MSNEMSKQAAAEAKVDEVSAAMFAAVEAAYGNKAARVLDDCLADLLSDIACEYGPDED